jgi:hypothetical protein
MGLVSRIVVPLFVLLTGFMAACATQDDRELPAATRSVVTSVSLATAEAAPVRVAYEGVSRSWPGRPLYAICVEDETSRDGSAAAARTIAPLIEAIVAAVEPGMPFAATAGCPYHYPAAPEIFRDSVSRFVLHVRVSDVARPSAEILEHWLPDGTDSATPVTFLLTVPRPMAAEPSTLRAWLETVVGPEPTRTLARNTR